MTENMKKFLELVSQNTELASKINAADKDTFIAIAKELGIDLTEADFVQPVNALTDDELEEVAGGKACYCVVGGGGKKGGCDDVCACVSSGYGVETSGEIRCTCFALGAGLDDH